MSRGRPGRRTAAEKREAVLALMAGKASVDQLARQYGVKPETVEKWREEALAAIEEGFSSRRGKSSEEKVLEQKLRSTQNALTEAIMKNEIMERAINHLKSRTPSKPTRSSR